MTLPTSHSGNQPASTERFALRAVGKTDVGRERDVNEDDYYIDDALGVYLVCDGMGGHASGQVASQLAVRTIADALKTGDPPAPDGVDPLANAMKAANSAIYRRAEVDAECRGMGTTAVGMRAEDDMLHLCHAGDSRIYQLRNGEFTQLTRDHSLVNLYKERPDLAGRLGPATSNVIIRAIGLDEDVEIDHRNIAMEHADVYLLCCDGLTDLVDDWMIKEIMTSGDNLETVADQLVRAANSNGGTDNITVILVSVFNEAMDEGGSFSEDGVVSGTIPGY